MIFVSYAKIHCIAGLYDPWESLRDKQTYATAHGRTSTNTEQ